MPAKARVRFLHTGVPNKRRVLCGSDEIGVILQARLMGWVGWFFRPHDGYHPAEMEPGRETMELAQDLDEAKQEAERIVHAMLFKLGTVGKGRALHAIARPGDAHMALAYPLCHSGRERRLDAPEVSPVVVFEQPFAWERVDCRLCRAALGVSRRWDAHGRPR